MKDRKLTKNDMARVIVQALWYLPTLPDSLNPNVIRLGRQRKMELNPFYKLSLKIIQDGLAKGAWPMPLYNNGRLIYINGQRHLIKRKAQT